MPDKPRDANEMVLLAVLHSPLVAPMLINALAYLSVKDREMAWKLIHRANYARGEEETRYLLP